MRIIYILLLLLWLPASTLAYVSGINDPQSGRESKLDAESQQRLDDAILTYYQNKRRIRLIQYSI